MYLNKYYFNTADPIMAELWDDLCARKLAAGIHLTILPQSVPRLDKVHYNVVPMGHYRLDVDGGRILYDFVLYDDPAKVIMAGYCLVLFEPTGRLIPASHGFNAEIESVPIPPLPAPPPGWTPEELPEPSRTAQAVEAFKTGAARTQAEAARMFGIAQSSVCVAMATAGIRTERTKGRAAQAVDWLLAEPGRTQAEAARMFGAQPSNVSVELAIRKHKS